MGRHVLFISAAFYPNGASGAHRPSQFAKYLPEHGWTPFVVRVDWTPANCGACYAPSLAERGDFCETVSVPYGGGPKNGFGRLARRLLKPAFPYRYPFCLCRSMLAAADAAAAQRKFDAIWSTYRGGVNHYVASRISRKYGIPWVADFRDLPDQSYDTPETRRAVRAEIRTCASAAALVTTSPALTAIAAKRHQVPVHTILNGFDPDDFPEPDARVSSRFCMRYFGVLYEFRDPAPLLEAVDLLAGEGGVNLDDLQLEFYGSSPERVAELVGAHRCAKVVRCEAWVDRHRMIPLQQKASVLLLLKSPGAGGSIPAKLFEYLAAKRPILNIPGDGDVVDGILRETGAGMSLASPEEIARTLGQWYKEWRASGAVPFRGVPERIAAYSRRSQAGTLAKILEGVCGGKT